MVLDFYRQKLIQSLHQHLKTVLTMKAEIVLSAALA